jgi:hypothetical protein
LLARAHTFAAPGPQLALGWARLAGDLDHARPQLAYLTAGQPLPDDALAAHLTAYAAGRAWAQDAAGPLPPGDAIAVGEGVGEAWADTRPADGLLPWGAALTALDAALAHAPPPLRAAALRAAAWRRRDLLPPPGEDAPPAVPAPAAVEAALGFAWGRAAARLAPGPGPGPVAPWPARPGVAAGLAFGRGERWGPAVPLPPGLAGDAAAEDAWVQGASLAWWPPPGATGKGALRGKP